MITKTKAQAWRTPRRFFDGLHADMHFTIDAMASISNHLLPRYWTKAHNALKQDLRGERAFVNPPYGMIPEALAWGLSQKDRGFSCFLVPGSIETAWFHDIAVHGSKTIMRRRVEFEAPPGVDQSTPSFPCILVMFGPGVGSSGVGFSATRCGQTGVLL